MQMYVKLKKEKKRERWSVVVEKEPYHLSKYNG